MTKRRNKPRAAPPPLADDHLRRALPVVCAVGLAVAAVLFTSRVAWNGAVWLRMLSYPAEVNVGEGVVLYEALRLSRGLPIYKAVDEAPYWFCTYPPLYQLLISPWAADGYVWPRTVSLLSSLTCAALLGLMVWRATGRRLPAIVAAGLWLTNPYTDYWSAVGRVDMLGRALAAAAVFVLFWHPSRRAALAVALVLATLAMLTKQTFVAGGLACVGLLWFESRRRALLFAAGWVTLTAAGYGILTLATGGWFWRNAFSDAARDYNPAILVKWLAGFAQVNLLLMAAAAVAVVGGGWREPGTRAFMVIAAAGLPAALLSGNDGVDVNYFFDVQWGLTGLGVCSASRPSAQGRSWREAAGCTLLLVSGLSLWLLLDPVRGPSAAQADAAREIITRLRDARGPVLCEFVGYTLAVGQEPDYLPYMYKKLEDRGNWSSEPMVRRLEQHHYRAVLVTSQAPARWGGPIISALEKHYEVAAAFEGTFIVEGAHDQILWRPKAGR